MTSSESCSHPDTKHPGREGEVMKITEITVQYGRTVQPRNYESIQTKLAATATVDEGEDISTAYDQLYNSLRNKVIRKVTEDLQKDKEVRG